MVEYTLQHTKLPLGIHKMCRESRFFLACQALEMFDDAEEFFGRLPESYYGKFLENVFVTLMALLSRHLNCRADGIVVMLVTRPASMAIVV